MTVFVLCNAYQEADNLPRMWESVKAHVSGEVILVVVDGKYPDYPDQDDFSSDGTREHALANGYLVDSNDFECEKRTAGLRFIDSLASDGDWVLNLDADEELTSMFGWPERVGYISFTRESRKEVTYGRCRLYRWEPGLEFKGRHYDLFDASGDLVSSLEDAPSFDVAGAGVHHDHRPKVRQAKENIYYGRLRKREGHPSVMTHAG